MKRATICPDRLNRVSRNISAFIKNGSLHIEGQDLGSGTPFGDNEYEYFYTFSKEETRRIALVLELPDANAQLLQELVTRFRGIKRYLEFRKFIKEHLLEYDFFSILISNSTAFLRILHQISHIPSSCSTEPVPCGQGPFYLQAHLKNRCIRLGHLHPPVH